MYCHCNLSGMEFLDNALGFYMDHLAGGRVLFAAVSGIFRAVMQNEKKKIE